MSASAEPPSPPDRTGQQAAEAESGAARWKLSAAAVGIILLYGSGLYSFGLLHPRTLTFHETIFAQPAREMVATGNRLVPWYAGQVWDDKPPLTCWLIAAAMTVFQSRHEAVVHLPNILVTLAAALMAGMLTARWYGSKVGLLAGLVQLTAYYTLMQGRLAEADMPLGTAVLGAMTVFALANIASPAGLVNRGWMPALFYLFAGLAFLTKGPIGPAFIGLPCGLYALGRWKWRIWRFLLDPIGWAVFLFLVLAWPLAAYHSNPEIAAGWFSHNVGRFTGKLSDTAEQQPRLFYFYMVPLMLLPWTPTLIWAFWSRWWEKTPKRRNAETGQELGVRSQESEVGNQKSKIKNQKSAIPSSLDQNDKYLWWFLFCWFVAGFVLLCLSSWKAKHYAIPILFAATPIIAWRLWQDVQTYVKKPQTVLAVGFAGLWVICVLFELLVQPHFDDYKYQAELARRINHIVPAGETIYFFIGDHRPHLAYYLERPMQMLEDQPAFEKQIKQGHAAGLFLITQRMNLDRLRSLTSFQELDKTDKLRPNEDPMFRQTLIHLSGPITKVPATQPR